MQSGDKFCAGCATPLELRESAGRPRPVCPNCGRVVYYDPKIAATAIIQRQGQVLLIRRAGEVGYGLWSMPGGYVDQGEPVEAAAAREAWEETGLEVEVEQLVGLLSEAGNPVIVGPTPCGKWAASSRPDPRPWRWGSSPWRSCRPSPSLGTP